MSPASRGWEGSPWIHEWGSRVGREHRESGDDARFSGPWSRGRVSKPQREPRKHRPVTPPPATATVRAGLVLRGQALGRPWPRTFPLTQCPPPEPETLPLALTSSPGAPAKPHMPVWAPPRVRTEWPPALLSLSPAAPTQPSSAPDASPWARAAPARGLRGTWGPLPDPRCAPWARASDAHWPLLSCRPQGASARGAVPPLP